MDSSAVSSKLQQLSHSFYFCLQLYMQRVRESQRDREMERYAVPPTSHGTNFSSTNFPPYSSYPQNTQFSSQTQNTPSYSSHSQNITSYSSHPQNNTSSYSSYHPQPEYLKSQGQVMYNGTDLDIFQAERYFKENQHQKHINQNTANYDHDRNGVDDVSLTPRLSSVSSLYGYGNGRNYTSGSFHATPTASSEASWNSTSGLLSNPPGYTPVTVRNLPSHNRKKKGYSLQWCLGLICPCYGKNSVRVVEDKFSEHKRSSHLNSGSNGAQNSMTRNVGVDKGSNEKAKESCYEKSLGVDRRSKMKLVNGTWKKEQDVVLVGESSQFSPEKTNFAPKENGSRPARSFRDANGFSFPVINAASNGRKVKSPLNSGKFVDDHPLELSEVFQPPEVSVQHKSGEFPSREKESNHQKESNNHQNFSYSEYPPREKQNNHQNFSHSASPKTQIMTIDDEVEDSDASSELFEIESFPTHRTRPRSRRRTPVNDYSCYSERQLARNDTAIQHYQHGVDAPRIPNAPNECFEPIEANTNWSIATAEGFDGGNFTNMSIAATDCNHVRYTESYANGITGGGKRKGNGMLNRRREKAVNVQPHTVRCTAEQCHTVPHHEVHNRTMSCSECQPHTMTCTGDQCHAVNVRPHTMACTEQCYGVNVRPHTMTCTGEQCHAVNFRPQTMQHAAAEQCHVGLPFPVEAGRSPAMSQSEYVSSLQVTKASGKPPLVVSHTTRRSRSRMRTAH